MFICIAKQEAMTTVRFSMWFWNLLIVNRKIDRCNRCVIVCNDSERKHIHAHTSDIIIITSVYHFHCYFIWAFVCVFVLFFRFILSCKTLYTFDSHFVCEPGKHIHTHMLMQTHHDQSLFYYYATIVCAYFCLNFNLIQFGNLGLLPCMGYLFRF